ncbi:hypothetical protein AB6A40_008437 [Gnathostoma spinigerum]|uniref:Zinc transporter ZIP9 n=1 Tax=Gnathostoma spinigerum TaxID=75299 RepID=A0ABD6EP42_9BILA
MLHKSPAAFGLVSFLLLEGLERSRIRKHLLIFSFSAPASAILTFYAITSLGSELLSSQTACGILMLFSAGTFLYVSTVHILPELMNDDYQPVDPVAGIGHTHSVGPSFSLKELAAILVGAFCPALLASGHSH